MNHTTDTLGEALLRNQLREAQILEGILQDRLAALESQKRALLETVTDLQAVVRLLSANRLRVA